MDRLTVIHGDCVEEMRKLPAESVHLWVTSPPYWGLRDYKIPPSVWGGDENCAHEFIEETVTGEIRTGQGMAAFSEKYRGGGKKVGTVPIIKAVRGVCLKCNAWRGVFGLEPTPELYLEHAVLIFREAKRVLRKDGTLWVNLGDSYAAASSGRAQSGLKALSDRYSPRKLPRANHAYQDGDMHLARSVPNGLKPGDLVGIPWRFALALQADGWYLRRDNIWFKPNPMPESVNGWRWENHRIKTKAQERGAQGSVGNSKRTRDMSNGEYLGSAEYVACPGCEKCAPNGGLILRKGNWRCTTAHEYVFQFSRSDSYSCDAEAAREKQSAGTHERFGKNPSYSVGPKEAIPGSGIKNNSSYNAARPSMILPSGRNLRSVWRIPTKPYRAAHFATFPPDLVRPIIAAASPVKCCATCGAPWAPVVERGEANIAQQRACGGDLNGFYNGTATKDFEAAGAEDASAVKARILAGMVEKRVIDHRPTCGCDAAGVPAVVGDMFGGSGTVGQVALELGRAALLIEISAEYQPLIQKRCAVTIGMGL